MAASEKQTIPGRRNGTSRVAFRKSLRAEAAHVKSWDEVFWLQLFRKHFLILACITLCHSWQRDLSKKGIGRFYKDVWKRREKASCFHQALLKFRWDLPCLVFYMCLRHARCACPGSPGEHRDTAFCSWRPTGCENSIISSPWLGNDWNDSAGVVSVACVTFLKMTAVWSFFASTFSNFPLLKNDQLQRKSSPL